jgi:hypothetical protein
MKLFLGSIPLPNDQWHDLSEWSQLNIGWDSVPGTLYTLIIYDMDAPSPTHPTKAPLVHLLLINIPGSDISKGQAIASYIAPNPLAGTGQHKYMFQVYRQSAPMPIFKLPARKNFNIKAFTEKERLHLIDWELMVVDTVTRKFYRDPPGTHNSIHPLIRSDTALSESEQKFCACVVQVAAKQPGQCNLEKAWFEERDGATCYNPYAVCAKSTGASSRLCGSNYDYSAMTQSQLVALAQMNMIRVPTPYDRSLLISALKARFP